MNLIYNAILFMTGFHKQDWQNKTQNTFEYYLFLITILSIKNYIFFEGHSLQLFITVGIADNEDEPNERNVQKFRRFNLGQQTFWCFDVLTNMHGTSMLSFNKYAWYLSVLLYSIDIVFKSEVGLAPRCFLSNF